MAHQHPLGASGRPAGVDDRAEILGADVGSVERRRLELVSERQVVLADIVGTEAEQREIRVPRLELACTLGEVVGVEHEAFDLGVADHVGVIGERAHRVERGHHAAVDERRRQVREHLRTVLRQHGETGTARHAAGALGLDQLAGPAADLGVRRDPAGEMDARGVVARSQAADDEMREQRLVVERRRHVCHSNSQTSDVSSWHREVAHVRIVHRVPGGGSVG